MDCIQSIQKAIDYMEANMLENISYEDAARHLHMSNYHFHRLFSMLTGMTANEYIRSRRLSMAGQELIMSDAKIIDIALKYGYDSPDGFAKAFYRFHGVTPNMAKQPGAGLQLFNRLVINITWKGGMVMEYRIVEREKFKVLAKVEQFRNSSIDEEGNTEIPDFWKKCGEEGVFDTLTACTGKGDIYGVCGPVSRECDFFSYGIGKEYEGGDVPDGFCVWEINPTLWAVFSCIGKDGDCIGETWDRIFKEFLPGSDYNMKDDDDFELYLENPDPGCFCEIWIPVEKK